MVRQAQAAIFRIAGPVKGAALIRLAFVTLGQHDFAYKPKYLEPVKMVGYLDDENESIRRAAALAFCRVQHRNAKMQKLALAKKETNGYLYNGYKVTLRALSPGSPLILAFRQPDPPPPCGPFPCLRNLSSVGLLLKEPLLGTACLPLLFCKCDAYGSGNTPTPRACGQAVSRLVRWCLSVTQSNRADVNPLVHIGGCQGGGEGDESAADVSGGGREPGGAADRAGRPGGD